jgi:hypothetical protein
MKSKKFFFGIVLVLFFAVTVHAKMSFSYIKNYCKSFIDQYKGIVLSEVQECTMFNINLLTKANGSMKDDLFICFYSDIGLCKKNNIPYAYSIMDYSSLVIKKIY